MTSENQSPASGQERDGCIGEQPIQPEEEVYAEFTSDLFSSETNYNIKTLDEDGSADVRVEFYSDKFGFALNLSEGEAENLANHLLTAVERGGRSGE